MSVAEYISEYEELCENFEVISVTTTITDLEGETSYTDYDVVRTLTNITENYTNDGVCSYDNTTSIYDITYTVR